jgi:outer membrane protein OmpA-like peptidoglycan-associated protein
MCPRITGLLVLASTSLLAGCATLLTPRDPPLTLRTHPDSVTVRHADGRVLGTAPITDLRLQPSRSLSLDLSRDGWQPARVPVRRRPRGSFALNAFLPGVLAMVALEAGADPGDVALLALAVPIGALVDFGTGAVWEHDPRVLDVTLLPLPRGDSSIALPFPPAPPAGRPPDLPLNPARATVAATLLLRGMAQAADEAGCDPAVSETWLDESDLIAGSGAVSLEDSTLIGGRVRMQVDSVRAELRALCARSNPLLDSLRAVRSRLAGPAPEAGEPAAATPAELCEAAAFGHCITFAPGSAQVRPEVQPALRQVAEQISGIRLPVRIVVQGTADPGGDPRASHRLGLARATAVRDALVRLGVPGEWLAVESCGAEARCQLVPEAAGSMPGAELNRRVAFHLRMRESRP